MCGIVGFEAKTRKEALEKAELTLEIMLLLEHRGKDSFGFIGISHENKIYAYKSTDLEKFFENLMKYTKEKNPRLVIAHHRKATVGKKDIENAHPVWNKKERVFVIQNGTKRSLGIKGRNDTYGIMVLYLAGELEKEDLENAGNVIIVDNEKGKVIFKRGIERSLWYNPELKILASEPACNGIWYPIKEGYYEWRLKDFSLDLLPLKKNKKVEIKENELIEIDRCQVCYTEGVLLPRPPFNVYKVCPLCYEDDERYYKELRKGYTYTYSYSTRSYTTTSKKKDGNKKEEDKDFYEAYEEEYDYEDRYYGYDYDYYRDDEGIDW